MSWVAKVRFALLYAGKFGVVSLLVMLFLAGAFPIVAYAGTGAPEILDYQGRLLDSSGNLLGGTGAPYCFEFSLYDNPTVGSGSKLWPASTPSPMIVTVTSGVFNVGVGDTNAGGDLLNYNFQDSNSVYLNVAVANYNGSSCGTFENLSPRERVTSSGYAINSNTVGGFSAAQEATGNQIPVLESGVLVLGGSSPFLNATGTSPLTFQGGGSATGNIQFFNSSNSITSGGNASFSGFVTAAGATLVSATTTNATSTNFAVTNTASTSNLVVSNSFTFGSASGILKAIAGVVSSAFVNLATDVTGVLPILNGGTGTSSAPIYGQVLVGNALGGYNLVSTSSLGIQSPTAASSTLFADNNTFTGRDVFKAIGLSGTTSSLLGTDQNGTVVATTSIGTNYLSGSLGNINGQPFTAGGSITVGSTTLLSNNNTWTGFNSFSSASATLATLGTTWLSGITNAVLYANASGQIVATSSINTSYLNGTLSVGNGGTGTSTAPSFGQLLVGNGSGGYNLTSTSSLGISGFSTSSADAYIEASTTIPKTSIANTFTGAQAFTSGISISGGATTTADNGIDLSDGCFSVNGTCITGGGGGSSGTLIHIQVFTSPGTTTYTPSAGATSAQVIVTGGGGGGGEGAATTNLGGAGGSAGTSVAFVDLTSTSSVQVVVGAAGASKIGASLAGGTGGNSRFSTFAVANGGVGGTGGSAGAGGVGGAAGTGSMALPGAPGSKGGSIVTDEAQLGGASYWGGGAGFGATSTVYGAGGGPNISSGGSGAGGTGVVVVYEYGPFQGVMGVSQGGLGTSTAATNGNILQWNGLNWQGVSTSSLSIAGIFSTSTNDYYVNASTTIAKTYTANTFTALQTINSASTTNLTASYASTSNFTVSSGFSFGSASGILKAVAGVVSSAFVNLASDVTGILPVGNGGTGWSNVAAGAVVYGNGANSLATTSVGTAGQILAILNGIPTWTATTTFAAPLQYTSGSVSINAANATTNGYLAQGDWTTFNNKVSSTSLSALYPLTYNSATGQFSSAFSTTTSNTFNNTNSFTAQTTLTTASSSAITSTNLYSTTASTSNLTISNTPNAVLSTNGSGQVVATTSIGTNYLTGNIATINGTPVAANGSATISAASSTLLSNNNTFSGTNTFSNITATNATTTTLGISGLSNVILGTNANGSVSGITVNSSLSFTSNTIGLNLSNPNIWSGLQTFGNASTTALSALAYITVGSTATTTIQGNATGTSTIQGFVNVAGTNSTSTFSGGVAAKDLSVTGTATSTFTQGVNIAAGCFAVNGVCVGGATGSSASSTLLSDNNIFSGNNIFNRNLAVGTSSAQSGLVTLGTSTAPQLIFSDNIPADVMWAFRSIGNSFYLATSTANATSSNPILAINNIGAEGSVGVGTSSTYAHLAIEEGMLPTAFVVSNTGSTTPSFWVGGVNQNGDVGVGTSTDLASFSVQPLSGVGQIVDVANSVGTSVFHISSAGNVGVGTTSPQALFVLNGTIGSSANIFQIATSSNQNILVVNKNGLVGLGSSTPDQALTVNGNINVAAGKCFMVNGVCIGYITKLSAIYATTSAGTTTVNFTGAAGASPVFGAGTLTIASNISYYTVEGWGAGGGGGSSVTTAGTAGVATCYSQGTVACSVPASGAVILAGGGGGGAVGVGTAGGAGGVASTTLGSLNINGQAGSDGSNTELGGFGGSSPRGGSGGGGAIGTAAAAGAAGNGPGGGGAGGRSSTTVQGAGGGGGSYSEDIVNAAVASTSHFVVGAGGAGGTTATVGGKGANGGIVITIYATSSPTATGNDYAEMFPVSNPSITAGDIVAVDTATPVSLTYGQEGSVFPLAGIVSTSPGQTIGDSADSGYRPIALSGRVPVNVNLEGGPIAIGDRIAPSSVPGVGKKAGPFEDSVGIALTSYDGTEADAQVTTFVDLQQGIDINSIALGLLGPDVFATSSTSTASSTSPLDFVGSLIQAISNRLVTLVTDTLVTNALEPVDKSIQVKLQSDGSFEIERLGTATSLSFDDATNSPETLAVSIDANGNATFAGTLAAAGLTIGAPDAPSGITMYDDSGAAYCAKIVNQTLQALPGVCGQNAGAPSAGAPLSGGLIIGINGGNPASVNVGATYNDLGAQITGPANDLNLGIVASVDGASSTPLSSISIDTSQPGTHTIIYSATDQSGVTGTATRTVVVGDVSSPSDATASSTPDTSDTSQDQPAADTSGSDAAAEGSADATSSDQDQQGQSGQTTGPDTSSASSTQQSDADTPSS